MYLGDVHNLGKAVTDTGTGFIFKPRTVFWEWLFLSSDSPLRKTLRNIDQTSDADITSFLPSLKFLKVDEKPFLLCGEVEKLKLSPVNEFGSYESKCLGGLLALCAYFGITDIHKDNILMGYDSRGRFICSPIDIECVFEKLELLSQNQIVASKDASKKIIGFFECTEKDTHLDLLCESFIKTLHLLSKNSDEIYNTLLSIDDILKAPVRAVIRPTHEYVSYLSGENHDIGFSDEEMIQLKRGDVPYFFHNLDEKYLSYTGNDGEKVKTTLKRKDSSCLDISFDRNRNFLKGQFDSSFIKNSLCQICRSFDDGSDKGYKFGDSKIIYKQNKIFINIKNIWRLSCGRI